MADLPTADKFHVWVPVIVRWGDMDAYHHVNNARYLTFCESARIAYLERIGVDTNSATPRFGPAVVNVQCNFRKQVHYPATLDVGARVSKIGGKTFTIEYGIFRRAEGDEAPGTELVADGSSIAVWVDYQIEKAQPLPERLVEAIRAIDGDGL